MENIAGIDIFRISGKMGCVPILFLESVPCFSPFLFNPFYYSKEYSAHQSLYQRKAEISLCFSNISLINLSTVFDEFQFRFIDLFSFPSYSEIVNHRNDKERHQRRVQKPADADNPDRLHHFSARTNAAGDEHPAQVRS